MEITSTPYSILLICFPSNKANKDLVPADKPPLQPIDTNRIMRGKSATQHTPKEHHLLMTHFRVESLMEPNAKPAPVAVSKVSLVFAFYNIFLIHIGFCANK